MKQTMNNFSQTSGDAQTIGLPPENTKRWVISRKAQVVRAVESGDITLDQACTRYGLTQDELLSWQSAVQKHGVQGLRVTRLQSYRRGAQLMPRVEGTDGSGNTPAA